MNMPLTPGQDHVIDTIIDRVAADAAKVQPPAIDADARNAATINASATRCADARREYARRFLEGAWGAGFSTESHEDAFMLGREDGERRARVYPDVHPQSSVAITPEQAEEYRLIQNRFAGNRSDSNANDNSHQKTVRELLRESEGIPTDSQDNEGECVPDSPWSVGRWISGALVTAAGLVLCYILFRLANGGGR